MRGSQVRILPGSHSYNSMKENIAIGILGFAAVSVIGIIVWRYVEIWMEGQHWFVTGTVIAILAITWAFMTLRVAKLDEDEEEKE